MSILLTPGPDADAYPVLLTSETSWVAYSESEACLTESE